MSAPSALLNDLYQLTMACGYWREGIHERGATFQLFFRTAPFGGAWAVACGLPRAVELLRSFRFRSDELGYLAGLNGNDQRPLFDRAFLAWLGGLEIACDVDAVPEGTVVFPNEPLLRISGPIAHCQLLETALLNLLNFPTLVATKAARICAAARDTQVIEFGLRRAQGPDGGLTASRAAYVGGCAATSNLEAGHRYGIPVLGTHAHSWVTCFDDEPAAFAAWARVMPNNSIFLVDTYDTIQGVHHAVEAGRWLRQNGYRMGGIRLDSGALDELARQARGILDDEGFPEAAIVASNDLDEESIASLLAAGAPIGIWGVGTRLATAWGQPALGGVYKLTALEVDGRWDPRLKLSEDPAKVNHPGRLQIRRLSRDGTFALDLLHDVEAELGPRPRLADPATGSVAPVPPDLEGEPLLRPVLRGGRVVEEPPSVGEARERARDQLARLPEATRRLHDPEPFPVALEASLHATRERLVAEARSPGSPP